MNINSALAGLGSLAKGVTGLGLTLIPAALVVQIFFPDAIDIIGNLGGVVEAFTDAGLTGLVTLLIVLAIVD